MTDDPSSREPAPGLRIGNDVVDLHHPRCRARPAHDRLPGRILTPDEASWLQAAPDEPLRLRRLWSLWAAKETAFKVVSKLRARPPVFRHRSFVVQLAERPESDDLVHLAGAVLWQGTRVRVEGVVTPQFVHLAGWNDDGRPGRPPFLETGVEGRSGEPGADPADAGGSGDRLDPGDPGESGRRLDRGGIPGPDGTPSGEPSGVRRPLSRRARRVAAERLASYLARSRGPDEPPPRVQIPASRERPGRTPPRVLVDGQPRPDLDLSLSHHGRYVGWAFLVPPPVGEPRPGKPGAAPSQNPGR